MPKAARPQRVVISPRSAISCSANAVDDSASTSPATTAAVADRPVSIEENRQQRSADQHLGATESKDRLAQCPQSAGPQFQPDDEQQQDHPELRHMQDLLDLADNC